MGDERPGRAGDLRQRSFPPGGHAHAPLCRPSGQPGGGRGRRPAGRRARPALCGSRERRERFRVRFQRGDRPRHAEDENLIIDKDNWIAAVGPGVTSFELQQEASRHGLRVNTAEPAATVCGNIVCTGTFSTWSHAYGTAADGFIDMEFVDSSGRIFRLNDKRAPNVFAFDNAVIPAPGVCTEATVKLHPTTATRMDCSSRSGTSTRP